MEWHVVDYGRIKEHPSLREPTNPWPEYSTRHAPLIVCTREPPPSACKPHAGIKEPQQVYLEGYTNSLPSYTVGLKDPFPIQWQSIGIPAKIGDRAETPADRAKTAADTEFVVPNVSWRPSRRPAPSRGSSRPSYVSSRSSRQSYTEGARSGQQWLSPSSGVIWTGASKGVTGVAHKQWPCSKMGEQLHREPTHGVVSIAAVQRRAENRLIYSGRLVKEAKDQRKARGLGRFSAMMF